MLLYGGHAVLGVAAYVLARMEGFDAVNRALAAISTAGFSTRIDSIGHRDSLAIEAVSIPLMFLGRLEFFVVIVSLLRIVRDLPFLVPRVRIRAAGA